MSKEQLINKIEDKSLRIGVLGMGYVGLPLAVVFAEAGFRVVGIDPHHAKIEKLNNGISYIDDVDSSIVDKLVTANLLSGSIDFSELADCDAVSICVPTPLRKTGDPDLSFIVNATEELAKYLHKDIIIVLESTTYPGTTRELVLNILQENSGLKAGVDFYLAFSPERVDPGREDWTTINTPKVMGGITAECSEITATWYEAAIQTVVKVTSAEVAEMTKLLENTFRMVNIGLVNEMALMCDKLGLDVWEVINAAATKPFGFMKFTPGPGLGGHCIPIDPLYLSWKLKSLNYHARFIELASEINTNMPNFVITRVMDQLNNAGKALNGSNVLVLGAAYKPDIDDLRESPALDIIGLLLNKKANVQYHDPYIPHIKHDFWELDSAPDILKGVSEADIVVIITNHKAYDYGAILENANLIFDGRNAYGYLKEEHPKVEKL